MKILYGLLVSFCIVFQSCDSTSFKKSKKKTKVSILLEKEKFDKYKYLELFNSSRALYKGTKLYKDLIQKTELNFKIINRSDIYKIEENGLDYIPEVDSINYFVKEDTIYINHILFVHGTYLNLLPYIEFKDKVNLLKAPGIIEADVVIEGNDTLIVEATCGVTNISEFQFKISKNSISSNAPLFYHGEMISIE